MEEAKKPEAQTGTILEYLQALNQIEHVVAIDLFMRDSMILSVQNTHLTSI